MYILRKYRNKAFMCDVVTYSYNSSYHLHIMLNKSAYTSITISK